MRMTPLQCRLSRTALGWTLRKLELESGVNYATIQLFETHYKKRPLPQTIQAIRAAFEAHGITFIGERNIRVPEGASTNSPGRIGSSGHERKAE
jgi:transcriptional regulator with XRE-family HTH domain